MAADAQHVIVLHVVRREDFSCTLAERLVLDISKVLDHLDALPAKSSAMREDDKTNIEVQSEIIAACTCHS